MEKIEFFKHNLTEEDLELANQVLRSLFLTTGPQVVVFENNLPNIWIAPKPWGLPVAPEPCTWSS